MPDVETHVRKAMRVLVRELLDGPPADVCFVLNRGDRGLLAALDALSAEAASDRPGGRASVAAHVDHLRYGFELANRWLRGEDAWSDADYSASWTRQQVDDTRWRGLRAALRQETQSWRAAIAEPRELDEVVVTGMLALIVHLGYHVGAIRQLQQAASGPPATD